MSQILELLRTYYGGSDEYYNPEFHYSYNVYRLWIKLIDRVGLKYQTTKVNNSTLRILLIKYLKGS